MQGMLLVDGLYLATAIAQTGGATDAIRLLPYVHVVGVTLLCSYRTGLKLALWHTLLFLLVIEGARAGVLQDWVGAGHRARAAAGLREGATLTIAGLWVFGTRDRRVLGCERTPAPRSEARPLSALRDGGEDRRRPGVR